MAVIRFTLLMISIVNRGVAAGGGNFMRYGGSFLSSFQVYRRSLLIAQNKWPHLSRLRTMGREANGGCCIDGGLYNKGRFCCKQLWQHTKEKAN
jgi:hypothetical protein